jgi:hypothetical protein
MARMNMRAYLAVHAAASLPGAVAVTAALHVDGSPYAARTLAIQSSSASRTIALMLPALLHIRSSFAVKHVFTAKYVSLFVCLHAAAFKLIEHPTLPHMHRDFEQLVFGGMNNKAVRNYLSTYLIIYVSI